METEVETGVRKLQTKEHLEPPEPVRGKEGFSLWPSKGAWMQGKQEGGCCSHPDEW